MSRTRASGAYLGGIGTMLGVADVCPSCGQTHPEQQFSISHGGPRECPKVIMGSFPVYTEHEPEPISSPLLATRGPAARRIREFETPIQATPGSIPAVPPESPELQPKPLGVSWLRPPDLGEVL